MIAIQLPISFHSSRTVPVSDLCKNAGKYHIEKIYVWNTENYEADMECIMQRGVLEPWHCGMMTVNRRKTKIRANYPLDCSTVWAALTLKSEQARLGHEPPYSLVLEIWCN